MKKQDEATSKALMRLSTNSDFQQYLTWLQDSLDEQDRSNRRLDAEKLYRGQGMALCLEQILEAPEEARTILAKKQ